jgi:hypothetical protein
VRCQRLEAVAAGELREPHSVQAVPCHGTVEAVNDELAAAVNLERHDRAAMQDDGRAAQTSVAENAEDASAATIFGAETRPLRDFVLVARSEGKLRTLSPNMSASLA